MGSRWTPSGPKEIGIDGYIELFDAGCRRSLGFTLALQSKLRASAARPLARLPYLGQDISPELYG
jgi:hypothetical protein